MKQIQKSLSFAVVTTVFALVGAVVTVTVVDGAHLKGTSPSMAIKTTESSNNNMNNNMNNMPVLYTEEDWNRQYMDFLASMNGTSYFEKRMAAWDSTEEDDEVDDEVEAKQGETLNYKEEEEEENGRDLQMKPPLPALVARKCKAGMGRSVAMLEEDGWFEKKTNTEGKWSYSDSNYKLRFDIQNTGCAGGTSAVPLQNAWAYIWMKFDCAVTFIVKVTGKVGTQSQLTDYLNVFVDSKWVYQASATENNSTSSCTMANPMTQKPMNAPITLKRGRHDVAVQFASNAAKYHNEAYYEIEIDVL